MRISGWGKYPTIDARIIPSTSPERLVELLGGGFTGIARGLGRSYGDSALARQILDITPLQQILRFDEVGGETHCRAGLSLGDLLGHSIPRGWFLPVTPGTRHVTIGGAIASDVHGKNHHVQGTFCEHVTGLRLLLADGSIADCSRTVHPDLFHASCGGMGLTGVILDATLRLMPITSTWIRETIYKAACLEELLDLLDANNHHTYSVAWIDCLASGRDMGRALLMLGEHADEGDMAPLRGRQLTVPLEMPGFLLNPASIRFFNWLYYHRVRRSELTRQTRFEPYFYPLDGIAHWNRLYGKRGFVQYQVVLPEQAGRDGIRAILETISAAGTGSFLGVLKKMGRNNDNLLSFPMAGYTLALDFRLRPETLALLEELDGLLAACGGRAYLAKDARMNRKVFRNGYPRWEEFCEIRARYGADRVFQSLQSERLGL